MNASLAANVSSLPRLELDLYESAIDKDGRYGGVTVDECWAQEIKRLTRERNAVTLAHNYQLPGIQDIADYAGDFLGLSRITAETDADVIVFCGVHFMTEIAEILSPEKTVLVPDERAGRSLTGPITAGELAEWKVENPGTLVVSCVNTTTGVKTLADTYCISSNAIDVVKSIPKDQEILLNPGQFLSVHVRRETGHDNIKVRAGKCYIHANINGEEFVHHTEENADSQLFVHPEYGCANSTIYLAGEGTIEPERMQMPSTGEMLIEAQKLKENKPNGKIFVATEVGMPHQLHKAASNVDFEPVNDRTSCSYMKPITPTALLRYLARGADEVDIEPDIVDRTRASVGHMIAIGNPGRGE